MTAEDAAARAEAVKFADGHVPMALEKPDPVSPLQARDPQSGIRELTPGEMFALDLNATALAEERGGACPGSPGRRRTKAGAEAARAAKALEREQAKLERAAGRERQKAQRAAEREQAKLDARRERIRAAEGGTTELPAVVLRDGTVRHVSDAGAWAVCETYLGELCLDVETGGYPLGHELYELRTVQLGGEHAAVVFDAADPRQAEIASLALTLAKKLRAHSATADVIPSVAAGLISWDAAWAKMQDSVLDAKLTDPKMSGSDADALKKLADDLLREYAVSPNAEKDKNALFKEMGCTANPTLMTPPEKNGWYSVNKNSVVMTRYAGSDVLDLAAVLRVLPPIPVDESVMRREREFQAACAPVTYTGFQLDRDHVKVKIAEAEKAREEAMENVMVLSDRRISNPKSPDVLKALPEIVPGLVLPLNRKSKRPSADKEALEALCRAYPEADFPYAYHLFRQIAAYRREDTKLTLLLYPLEVLCDRGDGRMRPTVYTIEATTGRSSCRRPNGQQFSRQGGIRACVTAGSARLELVNGQWVVVSG